MPCFHPWKQRIRDPNGKVYTDLPSRTLPCGNCIGCRLDRSRDWATRIYHESKLHDRNAFVTLTYSNENLPEDYSVSVRPLQLFMKRLRKWMGHNRVRFFGCGEYGDQNLRPHYHLILFGVDFQDKYLWRRTQSGYLTYRSPALERLWPEGHSEIGDVTLQSAGYCARYVIKKINGEMAESHYRRIHPLTGLVWDVKPEFIVMSNRPGIGAGWYDQYSGDAFPSDFVIVEGKKRPVPRYYKKRLEAGEQPDRLANPSDVVTWKRKARALDQAHDNTPARLTAREESLRLKTAQLYRELDSIE